MGHDRLEGSAGADPADIVMDPAERSAIAHATAQLLISRSAGEEDAERVERLVSFAEEHGLDTLAELWSTAHPVSLPGALWRLYLVKAALSHNLTDGSEVFSRGLEGLGGIDAVVVGADRVCSNGDTANKIGTYMLALVAKEHNVPFYVAAPFTTLDTSLENGDCIEIEERPGEEIIDTSKAQKNMKTWNPAFDVTPAKYITGIITEKGMIVKMDGEDTFDVAKFVQSTRDI